MKKLFPLLSCLLLIGCGEKSPPEDSKSTGETPDPPRTDSSEPKKYHAENIKRQDTDVEYARLDKEAVEKASTEVRNELRYLKNKDDPFTGWVKSTEFLFAQDLHTFRPYVGGKLEGVLKRWYASGEKQGEKQYGSVGRVEKMWHKNGQLSVCLSEGKFDKGTIICWWENGQKSQELVWRDGNPASQKYWGRNGDEITYHEFMRLHDE